MKVQDDVAAVPVNYGPPRPAWIYPEVSEFIGKEKIMRIIAFLLLVAIVPAGLFAHAGHGNETGVFDPPHGGEFTKMAGRFAEVYVQDGKLYFCLVEANGEPSAGENHPENIVLKVTPKRGKTVFLRAKSAESGCTSWSFSTKAKLIKVEMEATVADIAFNAKVTCEINSPVDSNAVKSSGEKK